MIKRKGKVRRGLFVIFTAFPSIADMISGQWKAGNKWLMPLVVFLCVTGLVLVLAGTVEVLAPFIYTIF